MTDRLIKICGITTPEDARAAFEAGADVIGLNFVQGPRRIDLTRAKEILASLPHHARVWLLGRAEGPTTLQDLSTLSGDARITHVQAYGEISPALADCLREIRWGLVQVIHAGSSGFPRNVSTCLTSGESQQPDLALLDAGDPANLGGTGQRLDWNHLADLRQTGIFAGWPPFLLAGGLTADNVADAIRLVQPHGIDVSSGVESSPGRKDPARMRALVQAVRAVT
jgi:phosphoribosylanthranilate isomerase